MTEARWSSETSIIIDHTTRCHTPDSSNLYSQRCEKPNRTTNVWCLLVQQVSVRQVTMVSADRKKCSYKLTEMRRKIPCWTVTGYGQPSRFPATAEYFSPCRSVQDQPYSLWVPSSLAQTPKRPELVADNYLHLTPRIIKREATLPLLHTPSRRLSWARVKIAFLAVLSKQYKRKISPYNRRCKPRGRV